MSSLLFRTAAVALVLALSSSGAPAFAQLSSGALSPQESAPLGEIWVLLANARPAEAAATADKLLAERPRDLAVLTAVVEAHIAATGWQTGLDRYEGWLAARGAEEPLIVRRLATALLREAAADDNNPSAQLEALKLLASQGDQAAASRLQAGAAEGNLAQTRALAALGVQGAIDTLVEQLEMDAANPLDTIRVLGESRNPRALDALIAQASHPEPAVRQAAVEALGYFDDPRVRTLLQQRLKDEAGFVRGKAAAALYRQGDTSGIDIIQDLAASEEPLAKLAAANYMSGRPDATWRSLVNELVQSTDPEVRFGAATLLLPHDPEAARAAFETLDNDNVVLAIREEAVRKRAATVSDVPALRGLLRQGDRLARVAAAGRILEVTR
jgi:HEAT repeat protein